MAGLLGRTFQDDPGAVGMGGGGLLGPMTGAQKAAMLFAGLRDAVGNFSGRPTQNLNQLSEQYQQQGYLQQRRQDRLDKIAAEKEERNRPKYENVGGALYRIPGADGGEPVEVIAGPKKFGETRQYDDGDLRITEEKGEDGKWTIKAKAPRWQPQSQGAPGSGGGGSPSGLGGKTVDERMQNILLNGDPNSPQYAAAYGYLAKPRLTISETGQPVTVKQDLSWARPPMRDGKPYGAQPTVDVGGQVITPPSTQEQKLAAGFADRMSQAELDLSATEDALGDPGQVAKDSIPLVGNYLVNNQYQSADQAKRNWINAQLRRESGAVINPGEFDNANKQYFVRPGDSEETKKQKRRNRAIAEAAMRRGSSNVMPAGDNPNPPPGADPKGILPPAAMDKLKQAQPGSIVTFGNGQQWSIRDGKPVRIK